MGGFFGAALKRDCVMEVFFGTDYHSHLGTKRGGMAFYSEDAGFQRSIHNIENSPFRTKFDHDLSDMHGCLGIGCISDSDPQPILMRSHHGVYAITTVGCINNAAQLIETYLNIGGNHFTAMTGGKVNDSELVAALINQKKSLLEGIRFAQEAIDGSISILLLFEDCIVAARDKLGRLPIIIGEGESGHCVSFESFAFEKLGFALLRDIGPGEIVKITADDIKVIAPPLGKMKICAFLWTYYGYPNSSYEGVNVEVMRNKNGEIMARDDIKNGEDLSDVDCIAGIPDSGIPHAIGYADVSGIPFRRPFIKYTPTWPRSFMPQNQTTRNHIAKMKLVPVPELIKDKNLLFVDDSIVRGTQMRETVEFLYSCGANSIHFRSACPPIMYGCKYLNFSRSNSENELIARRTVLALEGEEGLKHLEEYSDGSTERGKALRKCICDELHLTSLGFQSIAGLLEAIGIDPDRLCTYCWTGKE